MTVTINGTTGYTGPIGAIGDLSTTGNTTLGDASGDTLTINGSTTTFTQGTANGVAYLNGSKVLTTGSALVFDGSNMGVGVTPSAWNSAYKVAEIGKIGTSLFAGTSSGNAILASNAYLNSSDAWTYANNGGAVYFRAANSDRSFTWNISSTGSGTAGAAATFTQAMTLDASGNLGLGVTPSASTSNYKTLQIGSSGNSYSIFGQRVAGSSETFIGWNAYGGSNTSTVGTGFYYRNTGDAATMYSQNAQHAWYIAPSGTAGNAITFTQAMTLDANGNLGLGTTSPSNYAGYGTMTLNGSNGGEIDFKVSNTLYADMYATTGGLFIRAQQSTPMMLWAGGSERMRIDSSGNVGIGGAASSGKLHIYGDWVSGNSTVKAQTITSLASGGTVGYGTFDSNGTRVGYFYSQSGFTAVGSTNSTPLIFETAGAERARLTTAGDLLINTTSNGFSASMLIYANSALRNAVVCVDTGTNYGTGYYYQWFVNSAGNSAGSISHTASTTVAFLTSSDKRLKHNIVDAPSALQKVNDVKVCSFDWIEDGHHVDYGFIAQDLYKVIPEAVGKGDDSETLEDPKGTWQVEYGRLTPILFKAIQELKAEFDAYRLTHP